MTFLQRNAYRIGCGAASLVWPFFKKRRKIAVDNLIKGKVARDEVEAQVIAKRSFCHFAGHVLEAVFASKVITSENWREHFDFSKADREAEKALLEQLDTPILLVSCHHGCWEAATHVIPHRRPMIAIMRMMDNPLLRRWMERRKFRGAVTLVDRNRGINTAVIGKWMKEKSAFTILTDQHAYGGAKLKFFGRPAMTVTSAARLAIRFGVPVVVGSFVRTGPFMYRAICGAPLRFGKGDERDKVAQILNDKLEEAIRQCPEQYLWIHRRWRDD
ncbi:MAG: lysophospholipid acyltransferase family protein [Kiritimatiellae bacterium]|nr:lysophospholipid acyltransferase family protein [Kiritimatiellia bacterium]